MLVTFPISKPHAECQELLPRQAGPCSHGLWALPAWDVSFQVTDAVVMHFQLLPSLSHLPVSLTHISKLELNSDDQSHCWFLSFCCLSSLMSSLNAARRPPWGGSRQSCAYTLHCSSNPAQSSVVLQPTALGHLLEETKHKCLKQSCHVVIFQINGQLPQQFHCWRSMIHIIRAITEVFPLQTLWQIFSARQQLSSAQAKGGSGRVSAAPGPGGCTCCGAVSAAHFDLSCSSFHAQLSHWPIAFRCFALFPHLGSKVTTTTPHRSSCMEDNK